MASSRGSTPERAKKQACITALIRPPIPAAWATFTASMTWSCSFFSSTVSWNSRGSRSQTCSAV